jgi:hypothetical protein
MVEPTQNRIAAAPRSTDTILLRFAVSGKACAFTFRWESVAGDRWAAFGDPVPVFSVGPRAGFHAHDVYHLTLLAETGWSAVLEILLAGARDGVFGGVEALAEEAVVLQHYLAIADPRWVVEMLDGAVTDVDAVARALRRGDEARYHVLRQLASRGVAQARIEGIPASFVARSRAWLDPPQPPPPRRSRRG